MTTHRVMTLSREPREQGSRYALGFKFIKRAGIIQFKIKKALFIRAFSILVYYYYVPDCHEARYLTCSGVSLSIDMPIDFSLSLAISLSMFSGTE